MAIIARVCPSLGDGVRALLATAVFCLATTSVAQGGTVVERSFMHGGTERSYLLYVPTAYDGSEEWPLVINYHGFNGSPRSQIDISDMNAVADTAGFLVAYPAGLTVNNPFVGVRGKGWNLGGGMLADHDDIDFSLKVVDHIKQDYPVDPARVHLTGLSMGAGMAYDVACAHPDQIASLAAVAEQMADMQLEMCGTTKPMSLLQIHGTADGSIRFEGTSGGGVSFSAAQVTATFFADRNACTGPTKETELPDLVTTDKSTVTLFEYTGCQGGAEVLFYRVNNGGHAWPGGGGYGNVNKDIHASAEILSFFRRNPSSVSPTAVAETASLVVPETSSLDRSFPNPFNAETTIRYDLSRNAWAELAVYDLAGRRVSTLTEGFRAAGPYSVRWNGHSDSGEMLASGAYLYRLRTGDGVWSRKLLLLK